tara:strand:+ start:4514 stop:5149 length:636 start_codon:yes stop_codon:yes gene_type:complete
MGMSDTFMVPFYKNNIAAKGRTALLGFKNNEMFDGEIYDLQLEGEQHWDINSDWSLSGKFDTIICLRCAYFSKNPEEFVKKCHEHLNAGGRLYVDWGIGDHWRFEDYKVGWVKGNEQEYAYGDENYLWSFVWNDSLLEDEEFKIFSKGALNYGYDDVPKSIFEEVPEVLRVQEVSKLFDVSMATLCLWDGTRQRTQKIKPQFYVLLGCIKK